MYLMSAMNLGPLTPRDLAIACPAGVAIAAACGLRAFLPLLALKLGTVNPAISLVEDGITTVVSAMAVLAPIAAAAGVALLVTAIIMRRRARHEAQLTARDRRL